METGFRDFKVVPSQGSHFFQNLTSFMIGYFTVNSNVDEEAIDWSWLKTQPETSRATFTRHITLDTALTVRMNGHSHRGVILKPGIK